MKLRKIALFGLATAVLTSGCLGLKGALDQPEKNSLNEFLALGLGSGTSGSQEVNPAQGGIVANTSMSLTVPIGALDTTTEITYQKVDLPAPKEDIVPLQAAYQFGPEDLQFNTAADLEICYDGKDVQTRGLDERTLDIQYWDQENNEYVSMGGTVNPATHCVSAPIYHFSTYILTAQILATGANQPYIGGAQFFPNKLIDGLPATVRTRISPDWNSGGSIATARFYYRTAGSGAAFKSRPLKPDPFGTNNHFYTAIIPGTDITAAGLEYYIEVYDNFNQKRLRPTGAPTAFSFKGGDMPDPVTPLKFQQSLTNMSAGFSRDLTLRVKGASSATWYPIIAESTSFAGGRGTTQRVRLLQWRFTATTIGGSNLIGTYGGLTSAPISNQTPALTIYPGLLNHIKVLYNNTELPDPFVVTATNTKDLDAAGYDDYNNFIYVKPVFGTTGGIGSFGDPNTDYGRFTAANVPVITTGTITATLGSYSVSYNVTVEPTFAQCLFDGAAVFDDAFKCVFAP